jgi:nitrite reductase/ring-hydroxylating ferredoxin subunit
MERRVAGRRPTDQVVGDLSDFHQTGPLCEAKRLTGTMRASPETGWRQEWVYEGEVVVCPWHGLEYHVPTGQCLAFREIKLRRYEVAVRDGKVVVRA